MSLESRYRFAQDLARRAGDLAARHFAALDRLQIERKGHQDLVSNADREVEAFVRREIAGRFPDDGIVGEEDARTAGTSGFDWVIDPIDGTGNFVRGVPAWCVALALVRDGSAVAAATYDPLVGELFHGIKGGGAFLNDRRLAVAPAADLADGSVGVGVSNRRDMLRAVDLIRAVVARGGVYYRNGSGALMLAYVAAGRLLAYVEEHMNAWDCIGGLLLVEEAGGRIHRPDPATVIAEGTRILAAAPAVFDELAGLLAEAFSA